MIRKNNKGLSLVELIVAVAILAVVGVAIMGFVAFSSRNYTQANKNVKLQYEQQMTVNRIRDIVLETSRAIAYDDTTHTLTVFSDTSGSSLAMDGVDADANPVIVSRIYFTEAAEGEDAGKLFLLTKTLTSSEIDGKKYSEISISGTGDELTDTVKEFSADLSEVGNGKVTLHITFKVGEREVEVHPEIALRNKIDVLSEDSELDAIYEKEIIEFTSNVAKVEISRDGKLFGQAKTDTIEMAGDSTTVDYDAVVTKKAYYKGTIDTSVTWELENLKEGYEACIVLDPVTGMLTLKNAGTKKPADYMNGDTFILKAISNEDPTKIARLRIKVGTNGVYPKTINYAETHKQDLLNAQLVYSFTHAIEYTSPIRNSEGSLVNPLTGNDVYGKIKYTVYGPDKTTLATIPRGAGFSTTSTDGIFRVVKSMEEQTYNIKVSVLQKNKDGEEVFCWITLYIEKGSVPDVNTELTVPQLYTQDEYKRADYNAASVQWTHGVPFYKEGDTEIPYYYWYEWEIEPVDNWGDSSRNKFNDNVYLYSDGNKGRSYTSYMTERMSLIYVEPRVDWSGTFTMRVSVRAKLSKDGDKVVTKKYRAKPNVKIYKNDAADNEATDGYSLSSGTQVWTTLAEYETAKANHTSLRVNWNYKNGYVDPNDIEVRITAKNSGYVDVYTYYWYSYDPNANRKSTYGPNPIISYRGYEQYQHYKLYALVTDRNNGSLHKKGYIDESTVDVSFWTINSVTRYNSSGPANEVIETVGGNGADIEVLDTSGTKHKVRVNGKVGYINANDYEVTTTEAQVDVDSLPYYKLPTEEKPVYDMEDITTTDRDEAYVSSKVVKINPVTLRLEPVETQFYKGNIFDRSKVNQNKIAAYFNTSSTVYLGKGVFVDDIGFNATEDYKYYGVTKKSDDKYSGYKLDNDDPNDSNYTWYSDYYKCFTPTFTGIRVDLSNYESVLGTIKKTLNSLGTTALQPYVYDRNLGTIPQNTDVTKFDSGIIDNVDNKLYMYVKMTPYYWGEEFTSFPSGVRWTCVVEGKDSANYVIANTVNGEYYYFNYTVKKELDKTPIN